MNKGRFSRQSRVKKVFGWDAVVNSKQLQMLIDHFIETAVAIDLIDPENPKKIISRIKRMFTRLQPDEMEASFLRGFLSAINKKLK